MDKIRKMLKKKGISPVIAAIILIAITIAIAIAVAAWVFGLFGSYVGGGAVSIVYDSDTYISAGTATNDFSFKFRNSKSSDVSIVSAAFGALYTPETPLETDGSGTFDGLTLSANADTIVLPGTGFAWLATPIQGATYTITFQLSDGSTMPVVLQAVA